MPLSTIACDDDAVVLAWRLALPAERVWSAFRPTLLPQWLGRPVECDVRPGGALVVDHGEGYLSRSEVVEADEPRRLVLTWEFPDEPRSRLCLDLRPDDVGTVVELRHDGLGELARSYSVGWATHLTFLEAALGGVPIALSQFWELHATLTTLAEWAR